MHDPRGRIELGATRIIRHLSEPLAADDFLNGRSARALVDSGDLVGFAIDDPATVSSPRIPFVSYPHEWTNAQFLDAGRITLAISEAIAADGFELKDASAWNVVFNGTGPQFCDHLSFARIDGARWWAFAQFVRHFILPLCLARDRSLNAKDAFKLSRDGLSPERARKLMGMRRFATRYWPLMMSSRDRAITPPQARGRSYHRNLYAFCRWAMNGFSSLCDARSPWSAYVDRRDHYTEDGAAQKRTTVSRWLAQCKPAWVIDLGCNTGEFTRLARAAGASVVAIDADHESVQALYLACPRDTATYPLVADLDDLSAGRGWDGAEFPGLPARLHRFGDVTLMLALIHHLAISHAVPYTELAALARSITKRYLIVELVHEADPLVARLCAQRKRSPSEFTFATQRAAFERWFTQLAEAPIAGTRRILMLMERR